MTFLDQIIADTAQFDPSIIRHENGDVVVRWRASRYGRRVRRSTIADIIGIEPDMIDSVNLSQFWELHIPKEIAEAT